MKAIQLLYAKNLIVRHEGLAHQHLAFSMAVQHLAVEKLVEVHCAGEDGVWRILQAEHRSSIGRRREIWCAAALFSLAVEEVPLPGNIQFALHYRAAGRDYWENNNSQNFTIPADSGLRTDDDFPVLNIDFAANYLARRERLKILTLNLHCYQEENQITKFTQIAKAINDLNADIVCLQEVGELWNGGSGDWHSNAARIIKDQLAQPYFYQGDWSHLGFHNFREGSAILSKYPLVFQDSGYVSPVRDVHNINSRKVVMAQVDVPYLGLVNVFSVHLSWWNAGFREQLENLMEWAEQRHSGPVAATFLCGDFNNAVGSEGYWLAAERYEDQFLKANASGLVADHDQRIDYIFMKKGNRLQAVSARLLFTESDYGRVSDHPGVYAEFEPE